MCVGAWVGPVNPGRTVVGDRHHDDRRVRRHDAQDLPRHVRRLLLRADRRPDDRTSGSGNRLQLRALLLAHAGARQAAQEASPGFARGAGATEERRRRRWRPVDAADPTAQRRSQAAVVTAGSRRPIRYDISFSLVPR